MLPRLLVADDDLFAKLIEGILKNSGVKRGNAGEWHINMTTVRWGLGLNR